MAKIEDDRDSPDAGRLLTVRDVARILHISRSHVYLLIYSGELPTVRLGRSMRLHPDDVETLRNRRSEAILRSSPPARKRKK